MSKYRQPKPGYTITRVFDSSSFSPEVFRAYSITYKTPREKYEKHEWGKVKIIDTWLAINGAEYGGEVLIK